ncbi:MAG: HlyD family efflux transporter periplasmic adaptor subunit [Verrucomicrobia bacterium]|jgi:HlyD family secretion protein|nr:HlyD family efflux transporter periplasmic adaptor subunit [Verrucomicrobiota bacterium]
MKGKIVKVLSSALALLYILVLLPGCSSENEESVLGYVEGEYIYVAPTTAGILQTLNVERGDLVEAGAKLFALDPLQLNSSLEVARLKMAAAESTLKDLSKGARPEEISVLLKQQEELRLVLENEKKEYDRVQQLIKDGVISASDFDARETSWQVAQERLKEIEAQLAVANLGAREDQLNVAQRQVLIAAQGVKQAEKLLQESAPLAVSAGSVEDVFYRPGEFVRAGSPVVCILPPENIKIRFFISEKMVSTVQLGGMVQVLLSGRNEGISGRITFISRAAEFTPPVIYSLESREKLVFMIEATPEESVQMLRPGLPVNVQINHEGK